MYTKNDNFYLKHMLEAIKSINLFIKDIDYNDFIYDDLIISAVIRKFEILGEASSKISQATKEKYPQIEWRVLKDFRNHLIHQYFGVDANIIWSTIQADLPTLEQQLLSITI